MSPPLKTHANSKAESGKKEGGPGRGLAEDGKQPVTGSIVLPDHASIEGIVEKRLRSRQSVQDSRKKMISHFDTTEGLQQLYSNAKSTIDNQKLN